MIRALILVLGMLLLLPDQLGSAEFNVDVGHHDDENKKGEEEGGCDGQATRRVTTGISRLDSNI